MFYKGEIPFIRLIVPLIIGIVLGFYFGSGEFLFFLEFGLTLFLGLIIISNLVYKQANLFKRRWILGLFVHLFILLTGYVITVRQADLYNLQYFANGESDALIVRVTNEPQLTGDILRLETSVKQGIINKANKKVSGKLLVAIKSDSLNPVLFTYGDLVMIPGKYNKVDPPFNPSEFNFMAYLITKQIYQQCFINQNQIRLLKKGTGNKIISFSLQLRRQLVAKFYQYLKNKEAAALASTLILGYRANLSKEIISAYAKTGTMHILSVSGMHVGIVFLVLNALLKPLRKIRKLRILSAFIIISTVWFYAMITGFSPSVCRAAVMLSFVVLGKTFNKDLNTYNLLAISAFFLLLYNPYNLLDVGFQLSYLAVFGLIYFHPKIYHLFYIKNKIADSIWSYTALSLAAQLSTFPISIYYFHQFPVYFLISNLLVLLPVSLIMYAGITFLFIPWLILLKPLGYFLNQLILWTNKILYFIEDLPFSSISGIWISKSEYTLLYFLIAGIIWTALSAKKIGV
ncbi:MAG: ComEC family competence protein, partial [Flavobacterium sp.]|nr:ComEC family competence protein [Pedobacter sp.]